MPHRAEVPGRAVVLVEDNVDDVALMLRALRKANVDHEIKVARDGAEALDLLLGAPASGEPPPRLVLLDLKLPKLDGVEVLRRIRADDRTCHVPVVILTSSSEREDILAGYRLGANAYVRKPVRFSEFADAMAALAMFWLRMNEPPPLPEETWRWA